jgi:alkaline phosphatase D
MDQMAFERVLGRRASRRLAILGAFGSAVGLAAVSLPGRPTRVAAQDATPLASPVVTSTSSFGSYPFSLGVASGDPAPNGVILWTRLAPIPNAGGGMDPLPYVVRWELADDDGFRSIVQSGEVVTDPNLAHSVHIEVTGLEPWREYFYRFMVGSDVSQTGRTKTAPAPGTTVDRLQFAFASCANYEHGYFSAYRGIADRGLDLVFHLGDYIYEYAPNEWKVRDEGNLRTVVGKETLTLADYRQRFSTYRTDPDLQAAHASAPWAVTWDDHEVDNDYADTISENFDPVEEFLQRRADAYQAYYEHMPLRPSSLPIGPDMTLYRRLPYGTLAEFNVLDTRQYRSDQPCGDGVQPLCPASTDPATTLLGPAQERWVLGNLERSPAIWNVLAQQIMMTRIDQTTGEELAFWQDDWNGYFGARDRMLGRVEDLAVPNFVVLTGDVHAAFANDLLNSGMNMTAPAVGSEYVCTSISAGGKVVQDWFAEFRPFNPQVKYHDARHGGFTAIELTPDLWTARFFQVDDLDKQDSGVTEVAVWVTEAGRPGTQPA